MKAKIVNTDAASDRLRSRSVNREGRQLLLTRFDGSSQSKDFTVPSNCGGLGRIHHFRRSQGDGWPDNPLPIDPAQHALRLEPSDAIEAEVFQNAACSWRCWYCFVDYSLLTADKKRADLVSVSQLVDSYLELTNRPPMIDLSGGQPDLVAEWPLWVIKELRARGKDKEVYVWSDDNLSNDFLWRYLSDSERRELSSASCYGRVGCFKGFDASSFEFNTSASGNMFDRQFATMRRLVREGVDVYGYVTITTDDSRNLSTRVRDFVDRLQDEVHPLFPLRTVPLRVRQYTPTVERQRPEHLRAMEIQLDAVAVWQEEVEKRFSDSQRSKRVFEHDLGNG